MTAELAYVSPRTSHRVGPSLSAGTIETRIMFFDDGARCESYRIEYDCGCTIVGAVVEDANRRRNWQRGRGRKFTHMCDRHAVRNHIYRAVGIQGT